MLTAALSEPLGLILSSQDPQTLRTELFKLRKEFVQFIPLTFVISQARPESEVIILRQEEPDEKSA